MEQGTSKLIDPTKNDSNEPIHDGFFFVVFGRVAVNISKDNLEVDTSSYHFNVIWKIPLESIDTRHWLLDFNAATKDVFEAACDFEREYNS
nr:cysteine protease ATG4-like [Tanacetum cinerariifolium]